MENNETHRLVAGWWPAETIVYKSMNKNNHVVTAVHMFIIIKSPTWGKSPHSAMVFLGM